MKSHYPLARLCLFPFHLGLFSFYNMFGPTKWTHIAMGFVIPHGLLLLVDIMGLDRYLLWIWAMSFNI